MRLRLYHHPDGARVAYRETGAGPRLVLLHSMGLSYREWEPIVSSLARRFRDGRLLRRGGGSPSAAGRA
jgi:pimeloyl-ACP methyl ester carboxylesterase